MNIPKLVRDLARRKAREDRGMVIAEGQRLVADVLESKAEVHALLVADDAAGGDARAHLAAAGAKNIETAVVPRREFDDMADTETPSGVLAVVRWSPAAFDPAVMDGLTLMLDGIQDPGNVGTILRTAAAAGVEQVLLSKHCAFAWSPKVLRAGQGAHFATTIVEDVDLPAWIDAFAARRGEVIATTPRDASTLYDAPLREPWAVLVGNEGAGLSSGLIQRATARVAIPMHGGTESLNASAAAAVVLFELVRRRAARQLGRKSSEK